MRTFVLASCHNTNLEIIKYLFDIGFNVNNQDECGNLLLMNNCDILGSSLFMLACLKQTKEIISFLIDRGSDIFHSNENNDMAFTFACKSNNNVETIKYLINLGFDINHINFKGENGLSLACIYNKNMEIIKFLIENGASFERKSNLSCEHLNQNKELEKYLYESNYIVFLPFKANIMSKEQIEIFNILNNTFNDNIKINTLYEFIIKNELKGNLLKRLSNKELVDGFKYKQLLSLA